MIAHREPIGPSRRAAGIGPLLLRRVAAGLAAVGVVVGTAYLWWTAPGPGWACNALSAISCEPVTGAAADALATTLDSTAGATGVIWTPSERGDEVIVSGGILITLPPAPGASAEQVRSAVNGRTMVVARSWERAGWRSGRRRNRPGGDLTVVDLCHRIVRTMPTDIPLVRIQATEGRDTFGAERADGSAIRFHRLPEMDGGFFAGSCQTGWTPGSGA